MFSAIIGVIAIVAGPVILGASEALSVLADTPADGLSVSAGQWSLGVVGLGLLALARKLVPAVERVWDMAQWASAWVDDHQAKFAKALSDMEDRHRAERAAERAEFARVIDSLRERIGGRHEGGGHSG